MATREEIKGATDSLVIPDANSASLSIPSTVEALVREFVIEAINIRYDFDTGKITGPEATAKVAAAGLRMQDIFLGKDSRYVASDWNTVGKLGEYLRTHGLGGNADDAVSRVFNGAYIDVSQAIVKDATGQSAPGMAETTIDEVIARTMAAMLGAPPDTFIKQE